MLLANLTVLDRLELGASQIGQFQTVAMFHFIIHSAIFMDYILCVGHCSGSWVEGKEQTVVIAVLLKPIDV